MKLVRLIGGAVLVAAGIYLAGEALWLTIFFARSAGDYGQHHEVTVPLCRFLALVAASIGCALSGSRLGRIGDAKAEWGPLVGFAATAVVAWSASLIFQNEIFYSLFDPKGFPVHPTEVVIYPAAGWHGLPSHLLSALLLAAAFGWIWWTLRLRARAEAGRAKVETPKPAGVNGVAGKN
ncbi:MAG: hypothetical protein GX444_16280 [Myxococcales bacterium]|nr:hypothetical protein [Myxococcales bacterium]